MVKIILNAGHGEGNAHNRGGLHFNEGDNNYLYSLELKKQLEKYDGVIVDLVRVKSSDNPPLAERHKYGKGYDLFLSIHSNAGDPSVRGTEVWDSVETPNLALAKLLCDSTAEFFNSQQPTHRNRGVKYRETSSGFNWYSELRFNEALSSMILEIGFHTNKQDSLIFKENHYMIAVIQARAIASHYGLRKKDVIVSKHCAKHWAKSDFDYLNELGITIHEERFDDKITRGEVIALIARTVRFLIGLINKK